MTDETYMRLALDLAVKGRGSVNPNPMVGAIIVKDGVMIGQGYHMVCGSPHAERNALKSCTTSPENATLYVTLEPCCHWGRTPPCTEAIIESGIRRVVVGSVDPNPLVSGKGISILKEHCIEVTDGILKAECDKLNRIFFHFIRTKTPYVMMKYAMTMDGKIATRTGASQWVTGEAARHRVHLDRSNYTAIMVGVGTVLADDPLLTCRLDNRKSPIRIICDTHLRTPITARLVQTATSYPTILATSCTEAKREEPYLSAGCGILHVSEENGHIDLNELMLQLGQRQIDSILLEGGSEMNFSALAAGIVRKLQVYLAPKLFGGRNAKSPVGGIGIDLPDHACFLKDPNITRIEDDILMEWEVDPFVYRSD